LDQGVVIGGVLGQGESHRGLLSQRPAEARTSLFRRGHSWPCTSLRKDRSPRNAAVSRASGSTHRKLPDWPKCPKVAGLASGAVQCGDLSLRISYPSPQSLWVCLPNPGSTPGRPGNCTVRALSAKSAEIRV